MQGKLITFEGGEGVGKSTQIKKLKQYLESKGYEVARTREPGGCEFAEIIRKEIMENDFDIKTETVLFALARKVHYKQVIKPFLEAGYIVLCDRYIDSNFVYQGMLPDLEQLYKNTGNKNDIYTKNYDYVKEINESMKNPLPDFTFYLKMNPEKALKRIHENERTTNKFDNLSLSKHIQISECFDSLFKKREGDTCVILAEGDEEGIFDSIKVAIDFYEKSNDRKRWPKCAMDVVNE